MHGQGSKIHQEGVVLPHCTKCKHCHTWPIIRDELFRVNNNKKKQYYETRANNCNALWDVQAPICSSFLRMKSEQKLISKTKNGLADQSECSINARKILGSSHKYRAEWKNQSGNQTDMKFIHNRSFHKSVS